MSTIVKDFIIQKYHKKKDASTFSGVRLIIKSESKEDLSEERLKNVIGVYDKFVKECNADDDKKVVTKEDADILLEELKKVTVENFSMKGITLKRKKLKQIVYLPGIVRVFELSKLLVIRMIISEPKEFETDVDTFIISVFV